MTKFIIAKYVKDLARMEPRNIGLFVWQEGVLVSKFLETPSFVNELDTYKRWLDFWRRRTTGDMVRPVKGKPVSKADPKCLDALLSTQKGNYILVDAGELIDEVKENEIDNVLDYLFEDLVN